MRQNKFPFQPFSKRIIILYYILGYRSPTPDTIQTQIKLSLPTPALYDSKVLMAHEALGTLYRVLLFDR